MPLSIDAWLNDPEHKAGSNGAPQPGYHLFGELAHPFTELHATRRLALEAATSVPAPRVTRVLDRVVAERGRPSVMTLDNRSKFTGRYFDACAYQAGIRLDFIRQAG